MNKTSNMEFNINGIQIVSNLKDANFDSLKRGSQILKLIPRHKSNSDIYYNDLELYFVNQKK